MKERPNCHLYLTDIFQVSPSDQRLQRKANFGQIELKMMLLFDDSNTNIFFDLLLSVCGTETDIYTETMAIHTISML